MKPVKSLGIRHTRTKPGHAWTDGFVERLQGTILHEHWLPLAGDTSVLVRSSTGLCNGTRLSTTTIGRIWVPNTRPDTISHLLGTR